MGPRLGSYGPGQPMTAHWGIEDPAAVTGDDAAKRHAVSRALHMLNRRIALFTNLPFAKLDRLSLQNRLDTIGDLRKQGYDIEQIAGPVYVMKNGETVYTPLEADYVTALNGASAGF